MPAATPTSTEGEENTRQRRPRQRKTWSSPAILTIRFNDAEQLLQKRESWYQRNAAISIGWKSCWTWWGGCLWGRSRRRLPTAAGQPGLRKGKKAQSFVLFCCNGGSHITICVCHSSIFHSMFLIRLPEFKRCTPPLRGID